MGQRRMGTEALFSWEHDDGVGGNHGRCCPALGTQPGVSQSPPGYSHGELFLEVLLCWE